MILDNKMIEKLKKEEVEIYNYDFRQTSRFEFTFYQYYYNEAKTDKIKKSYKYKPTLYGTKYILNKVKLSGVYFEDDGIFGLIKTDDDDYHSSGVYVFNDFSNFEISKEKAFDKYIGSNPKHFIVRDNREGILYNFSNFFDSNTSETVNDFIKKMNENNYNFELVKSPTMEETK
jgi:hypothetical protein